ncbi:hypothetical protein F7734_39700 [Scytonema sp. UIC 10036]|uniref:hypothetical protein n=1 Tax=Scytonema sp. UIC 10036 TaxID=2304196 RepID=UPI0012DA05BA|nr:hypothetical protein [Scytonema sp. UIC 10036]MUG98109.1 hypothetical protein [Scytonema sp. UIC 10036]
MKFAAAAIIGALIKFIVVKTGISISAAVVIVLLPILGAVLAHEWMSFPKNLGEDISSSICEELDADFVKTNKEALSNVFQELLENQVEAIGKHLADDEEVSEKIGEVLSFLHA